MNRTTLLAGCMGLLLALPVSARAQGAEGVSNHDVLFVTSAALSNLAEIEEGRIASRLASNEEIAEFGTAMAAEHELALSMLEEAALDAGISLPDRLVLVPDDDFEPTPDSRNAEFDVTYMEGQIRAHQRAIALFSRQASAGRNQALRDLAKQLLPDLRDHLRQAYRLRFAALRARVRDVGMPPEPID